MFRAMSALFSAASPEKMDGNTKLRTILETMGRATSETMGPAELPTLLLQKGGSIIIQGEEGRVKVIYFSTQMSSQSSTWKMTTQIKLDLT